MFGPEFGGRLHVGDRDDELTVGVEHRGIRAGRPIGARHVLDTYAGFRGVVEQVVAHRVASHHADQVDAVTESGDVLGDVARNPSRRHRGVTGVAGMAGRPGLAVGLQVDVGSADDDGAGLLGEHISTAEDHTLLAEIGQVHVDRGPAGSQRRRHSGAPHQRITPKQLDYLLFPVREHLTSISAPCCNKQAHSTHRRDPPGPSRCRCRTTPRGRSPGGSSCDPLGPANRGETMVSRPPACSDIELWLGKGLGPSPLDGPSHVTQARNIRIR